MSAATIVRIASRGEGVTADGRHVALAAPGDEIGSDGEVVTGLNHAIPPCALFPHCGGCQLQHVGEEAYADFIRDRIASALASQGLNVSLCGTVHISPPRTRRRASLRAARLGKRVVIGFSEAASNSIVDMTECHILLPELFALVAPLRVLLARLLTAKGQARIELTRIDQGVDVALCGFEAEGLAAAEALTDFASKYQLARLSLDEGDGPLDRYLPEVATVTLGGVTVDFPHGGFLQATADGQAALVRAVQGFVGDAKTVADLFAGLGTFALAKEGAAHAVEGSRDAAAALLGAGRRAGRRLGVEHRDLFRRPLTVDELARFDAVVLDPPRAGAKEQVAALAASTVGRIAYVSCNPATFARDARTLADGGYELECVVPVGQFRWSTHVELAGCFRRRYSALPSC